MSDCPGPTVSLSTPMVNSPNVTDQAAGGKLTTGSRHTRLACIRWFCARPADRHSIWQPTFTGVIVFRVDGGGKLIITNNPFPTIIPDVAPRPLSREQEIVANALPNHPRRCRSW